MQLKARNWFIQLPEHPFSEFSLYLTGETGRAAQMPTEIQCLLLRKLEAQTHSINNRKQDANLNSKEMNQVPELKTEYLKDPSCACMIN